MKHKVVFEFDQIIDDDDNINIEGFISVLNGLSSSDLYTIKYLITILENQGIQTAIESGDK